MMTYRLPTNRMPSHPGYILQHLFLDELGMTQRELAAGIEASYQRVNELCRGKRNLTPHTALRLAKFFGTSVEFWINAQVLFDLAVAKQEEKEVVDRIKPYTRPQQHAAAD